ncbi:E3 SUMO-protein ligase [Nymphaea thermarum]|nr:E3 SUMO-protein ligase [Nymphaea thermarum]
MKKIERKKVSEPHPCLHLHPDRVDMSGSRIKISGRFKPCVHMGCFDLGTFVELNQRSRKVRLIYWKLNHVIFFSYCVCFSLQWQCPICLKNYSLESIIIDPYFNRITTMMMDCGEDVTEIEVRPDGAWRTKNEPDYKDLGQWHLPDGSLCLPTNGEVKHDNDMFKKQEGASERASLKLGIRKNRNGVWEVSKPDEFCTLSSPNYASDEFKQKIMARSSSTTGSDRDGEDGSVNQDGHFDFINNANELDSAFLDPDIFGMGNRVPNSIPMETDIIVLSDSDEDNRENLNVMPSTVGVRGVYEAAQDESRVNPFTVPSTSVAEAFPHGQELGIFQNNGDDYNIWDCPQNGGFDFFGADADVPDALVDVHPSVVRPTPINGYELASEIVPEGSRIEGLASQAEPSLAHLNNGINNVLDNPLSFDADDPSLQIFLPPRPVGTSMEADCRNQTTVPDDVQTEDWITLSLGGNNHEREPLNGVHSRQPITVQESRMDALANTGAICIFVFRYE